MFQTTCNSAGLLNHHGHVPTKIQDALDIVFGLLVSGAGALLVPGAFLGHKAGRAIDSRAIDVAKLPPDLAEGCLLAQPLAADAAMRFSRRFIWLHAGASCPSRSCQVGSGFITRQCCNFSIEI
jgi:hypothetical protein